VTEEDREFNHLKEVLLAQMGSGIDAQMSEDEFNDLALRVFHFQCRAVPAYGSFVVRRGVAPGAIQDWRSIPCLPTRAFKRVPLWADGGASRAAAVFRTSGTTRGAEERGFHHVRDLDLYRASLLPNFRAHLLPDGKELQLVSLLPEPEEVPDSSLAFMIGEVWKAACGRRGGFFGDPKVGVRVDALFRFLEEREVSGEAVLLAGTAFGFVRCLEEAGGRGWRFRLPAGSRIMETGGFKGRSREMGREELYAALEETFGIQESFIVNEYGMTELLSQFYEPVLAGWFGGEESRPAATSARPRQVGSGGGGGELSDRYHRPPPWVRTRVLDPLSLEPTVPGQVGILAHLDLANLGSISAVLTEDLGRAVPRGFKMEGRTPGAEPRGCSLAMEEFLAGIGG
jgi:hypothetical protein